MSSQTLKNLFDLVGGQVVEGEDAGPARRIQLMVLAGLATVVFAAIYGIAAGSTDASLALANVYKMPMVVLLSALSAIPAGLLTWKLVGARHKATDLLMGLVAANFSGTLVMAVLSPIVALYYHTSGYMGGILAAITAWLGLAVGVVILVRGVWKRVPSATTMATAVAPLVVIALIQLATLVQFVHLASPILPEVTVFDGGLDAMVEH